MTTDGPTTSVVPPPLEDLMLDQRRRWQQGECVRVEDYLRDRPDLAADTSGILGLVCHEILLREERGEAPAADEYLRRFPQYPTQLRLHLEVHAALRSINLDGSVTPANARGLAPPVATVNRPQVPGYEVLDELGRGAMGVVYRASQRAVALLTRARTAGYFQNPARRRELAQDADLDALRTRPDFQKLLADFPEQ